VVRTLESRILEIQQVEESSQKAARPKVNGTQEATLGGAESTSTKQATVHMWVGKQSRLKISNWKKPPRNRRRPKLARIRTPHPYQLLYQTGASWKRLPSRNLSKVLLFSPNHLQNRKASKASVAISRRARATYPKITNQTAKMEKTSPRKSNSQWNSSMRMMMPSSPWVTQRQRKRETEISSNTRYKELIYHIKHWMRPIQKRSSINSKTKSRRHTKMESIVRNWMSRSLIRELLRRA